MAISVLRRNHSGSFIEEESFSTACQYASRPIQIAVRSKLCEHFQCFDLDNFLAMNRAVTSSWRCPVCKKRAVELIRDKLFEECVNLEREGFSATRISVGETGICKASNDAKSFVWSSAERRFVKEGQVPLTVPPPAIVAPAQPKVADFITPKPTAEVVMKDDDSSIEILDLVSEVDEKDT